MVVVEFIKAIAWPAVAVLFLILFRTGIRTIFGSFSTKNWNVELPGGIKASVSASEQEIAETPANVDLKTALPAASEVVGAVEQKIIDDLHKIAANDKQQVLVRALSEARVQSGHEWVYNRIFGSQIKLLKRLNEEGKLSADQAKQHWAPYANAFPQLYKTYSFESWLNFLASNLLVEQNNDELRITPIGNDFLTYLARARLLEDKPW